MSITLLLEKYDISTEEGLQKALNEIEKEELEVDEALSNALGKACSLEVRLRTASQAYTKLGEMKNDALAAADMVERTAALAQDVSAKVRQLDLARTRVAECQRRVHDLIDLQLCSSGVDAAIKAHDLEAGAAHVARYLSMEPASLAAARARGALDPALDMTQAQQKLLQLLTQKFEEAARKDDEAGVERVVKLFPQVGRGDAGATLHAKYLARKLEASLPSLTAVPHCDAEACVFADAFTRVMEAAAAAVRRLRGALPGIKILQPVVYSGARQVLTDLVTSRRVSQRAQAAPAAVPELALLHRTLMMYRNFLRTSVQSSLSTSPEDVKQAALSELEQHISTSELTRLAQDVLSHYLTLERLQLEDNVAKAIRMFQQQEEESSLVDDVFYIAKRVITRAISTHSVEAVCVMLNECSDVLARTAPPLQPAAGRAPALLPQPAPPAAAPALPALLVSRMNEAETGAQWAEQLAADACAAAARLTADHHEREKVESCASGLSAAAESFRAVTDAHTQLLLAASAASCQAWCDALLNTEDEALEDSSSAEALPLCLSGVVAACSGLPARVAAALPHALCADILRRLERAVLQHSYTQKSGLILERRARRLAAWAGTNAPAARDRCARFTQICALLSLEQVSHCQHALSPQTTLTPGFIKDVLASRTDFKIEDIKRLKL